MWLSERYHTENGVDIINDKSWTLDPKTKKPIKTKSGYAQSMTSYTKDNFDKLYIDTIEKAVKVYRDEAWTTLYNKYIDVRVH